MNQVGPVSAVRGGIRCVGPRRNVEWGSALDRHNSVALPPSECSLQEWVSGPEKWNTVNKACHEAVAVVPVGIAVVGLPPIRLHRRSAAIGILGDVQRMRPGVVCI